MNVELTQEFASPIICTCCADFLIRGKKSTGQKKPCEMKSKETEEVACQFTPDSRDMIRY